jgi:hypothetical protein
MDKSKENVEVKSQHDLYVEKLPKTVRIFERTFEYDKDQVYYKNNVIT